MIRTEKMPDPLPGTTIKERHDAVLALLACRHYFPPDRILQRCERCGALKDETGIKAPKS